MASTRACGMIIEIERSTGVAVVTSSIATCTRITPGPRIADQREDGAEVLLQRLVEEVREHCWSLAEIFWSSGAQKVTGWSITLLYVRQAAFAST